IRHAGDTNGGLSDLWLPAGLFHHHAAPVDYLAAGIRRPATACPAAAGLLGSAGGGGGVVWRGETQHGIARRAGGGRLPLDAWHFAGQHGGIYRIYGRISGQPAAAPEWEKWLLRGFFLFVLIRLTGTFIPANSQPWLDAIAAAGPYLAWIDGAALA